MLLVYYCHHKILLLKKVSTFVFVKHDLDCYIAKISLSTAPQLSPVKSVPALSDRSPQHALTSHQLYDQPCKPTRILPTIFAKPK